MKLSSSAPASGAGLLLAGFLLIAFPQSVQSQGIVNMSWNACFGTPIGPFGPPSQNKDFDTIFDPYRLFVSAEGVETKPGELVFRHDVRIMIQSRSLPFPDAWRFDPTGCMEFNFATIHLNTLGVGGCPGLRNGTAILIDEYNVATSRTVEFHLAIGYTNGRDPDPGLTYLLADIRFDMSAAGTTFGTGLCLGADRKLCFTIKDAIYFAGPSTSQLVEIPLVPGQSFVTFNDVNNIQRCPNAVPSESKTWGRVKGLYR